MGKVNELSKLPGFRGRILPVLDTVRATLSYAVARLL